MASRLVPLFFASVVLCAACSTDLKIPAGAKISCSVDDDCPDGLYCNKFMSECLKSGEGDTTPPGIKPGSAKATPTDLTNGSSLKVTFEATEELARPPEVSFVGPGSRTLLFADKKGLVFTYTYITTGAEPVGTAKVQATLLDTAGNLATALPVVDVTFDFNVPRPTSVKATDPGPLKAAATFAVEITTADKLKATPTVATLPDGLPMTYDETSKKPVYRYTRILDGTETEGGAGVRVSIADKAGNSGTADYPDLVVFDFKKPTIAEHGLVTPILGKTGVLSAWATASESLKQAPALTLTATGGTARVEAVKMPGGEFQFSSAVTALSIPDGTYKAALVGYTDFAGNQGDDLPIGDVLIDTVPPETTLANVSAPSVLGTGITAYLSVTATEKVTVAITALLSGGRIVPLAASKVDADGKQWETAYQPTTGDPQGEVQFWVDLTDVASNTSRALIGTRSVDLSAPVLLSVTPDRPVAGVGQRVTFELKFNEEVGIVSGPSVAGELNAGACLMIGTERTYACSYDVTGAAIAGEAKISFIAQDAGTNNLVVTDFPAGFSIDFVKPVVSVSANPNPVMRGQTVFFSVTSDEDLGANPVVNAAFVSGTALCAGSIPGRQFSCSGATVSPSASVGTASFNATGVDRAGNASDSATGSVTVISADQTAPGLFNFAASPLFAKNGSVVTLTFDSTETLPADARGASPNPEVTLGGVPMACTASGLTYTCTYTVAAAMGAGLKTFAVTAADASGNVAGPATPSVAVTLDFGAPTLTVAANPNPVTKGFPIAFTVVSDEPLGAPPSITATFIQGTPSCNGQLPGTSFTCTGASVAGTAPSGNQTFTAAGADRAGNAALSAPGTVTVQNPSGGGGAAVTIMSVLPNPAKNGDTLTIDVVADQGLLSCSASIGPLAATCGTPSGQNCSCTLVVNSSLSEGKAAVSATGTASTGSGSDMSNVQIDKTAPVVDGNLLAIIRNAVGVNDRVSASAGAAKDDAGDLYADRAVKTIRIWSAATGGAPVLEVNTPDLLADGSFVTLALSGTDQTGPKQLWASAVDRPGNESGRTDILVGKDVTGPVGDGSKMTIIRRDLTQKDGVAGMASAFVKNMCQPIRIRLFDAQVAGNEIGSVPINPNGGFDEVLIGTVTSSFGRVWGSCVDKCGNEGQRAEAVLGTDTQPPSIDRLKLTFLSNPGAINDSVSAGAGAVTDAVSAVREVRIFLDPADVNPVVPAFSVAPDGSFNEKDIGPRQVNNIVVEATDKTGNVSARLTPRVIEGKYTTEGKTPHIDTPSPIAAYSFRTAKLPTAVHPGYGPSSTDELIGSQYASIAVSDSTKTSFSALTEINSSTRSWERTDLSPRTNSNMAFDSARGKIVLFSGQFSGNTTADTWEWDGGFWSRVAVIQKATGVNGHSMAYDPVKKKVVLFGGQVNNDIYSDETWDYDGVTWSMKTPMSKPPARTGSRMIYDSKNYRMLMFGGWTYISGVATYYSDLWSWNGTEWSQEAPIDSPPARYMHGLSYDVERQNAVLFGGHSGSQALGDTWLYDGNNWTEVTPANSPVARYYHTLTYDVSAKKSILFGGYPGGNETWEWDGTGWSQKNTNNTPPYRGGHASTYDSVRNAVFIFGSGTSNDLWKYSNGTWIEMPAQRPSKRAGHGMVFDLFRATGMLFGGIAGSEWSDTWLWSSGKWVQQSLATYPSASVYSALVYDSDSAKVIMFGGSSSDTPSNETWIWNGAEWRKSASSNSPPVRQRHAMAFDNATGRTVLFGGQNGSSLLADTWEYHDDQWVSVTPVQKPSARHSHSMTYMGDSGRIVLVNGDEGTGNSPQVWVWNGTNWNNIAPYGDWREQASCYDADRAKLIIHGGVVSNNNYLGHAKEFDGTTWKDVGIGNGIWRANHTLTFDPGSRRSILFGGYKHPTNSPLEYFDEQWEYQGDLSPSNYTRTQTFVLKLNESATLSGASITYVGAGAGENPANPGVLSWGLDLYIWDWVSEAWELLGSRTTPLASCDEPAGSACTITGTPVGDPNNYAKWGRIWVMATPKYPSSAPPSTAVNSEIHTDYIEVRANYTLP